jgi:hypothetical protein
MEIASLREDENCKYVQRRRGFGLAWKTIYRKRNV